MTEVVRTQNRKKDFSSFDTYIKKVLKQVHPDTGIKGEALVEMNNLVKVMIYKVMHVVNLLTEVNNKKTVTAREVQTAVQATFPGELARHGITEGTKAVTKYNSAIAGAEKGSASFKGGLQFPVARIKNRWMRKMASAPRVGETAAVYLAAVLEYITAEVLELAGNAAKDHAKKRITNRMVFLAIRSDEELDTLSKDIILAGGVIPHLHKSLLPKSK